MGRRNAQRSVSSFSLKDFQTSLHRIRGPRLMATWQSSIEILSYTSPTSPIKYLGSVKLWQIMIGGVHRYSNGAILTWNVLLVTSPCRAPFYFPILASPNAQKRSREVSSTVLKLSQAFFSHSRQYLPALPVTMGSTNEIPSKGRPL